MLRHVHLVACLIVPLRVIPGQWDEKRVAFLHTDNSSLPTWPASTTPAPAASSASFIIPNRANPSTKATRPVL